MDFFFSEWEYEEQRNGEERNEDQCDANFGNDEN